MSENLGARAANTPIIAASILSADFARLGEEVDAVLEAGANWVHFDVMDNHYVPNLTVGPMVCKALRDYGVTAPIDVHLMVEPVDDLIQRFADAGASYITFHPEASRHLDRSLRLIQDAGCKCGLVLNPASRVNQIEWLLQELDMILLMSVNPGFGGQSFLGYVKDKIASVRSLLDSKNAKARLEIDGGVSTSNISELAKLGADTFVSGSAIFNTRNDLATPTLSYKNTIAQMRAEIAKAS